MNSKQKLSAAVALAFALICHSQNFSVDWSVLQNSAISSGGPFDLAGTIGQPGATMNGDSFQLTSGFWSILAGQSTATGIVNGAFEEGLEGFTSDYQALNSGGVAFPGSIAVGTNPSAFDPSVATFGDHTTGSGNMLFVTGTTQSVATVVWQETFQVVPNQGYLVSAWATAGQSGCQAVLQFNANGSTIGTNLPLTSPAGTWVPFQAVWTSGENTSLTLTLRDLTTSSVSNSFALDDISVAAFTLSNLPTNTSVLYCRVNPANNASSIWIASLDGSTNQMITNGYGAHLSLDRNYCVFTRDGDNGPAYGSRGYLWVRNWLTGQETRLFVHGDYVVGADFVRDASRIIFDYSCADYVINRDGTGFASLSGGITGCYDDAPVVNPVDGRVALHAAGDSIIVGDTNCQNKYFVPNSSLGVYPRWSQDGNWISYAKQLRAYEYAGHNLYKIQPDGSGQTQLTFFNDSTNGFPQGGAWSEDGTYLVAAGNINGVNGLFRVATDGTGSITRIPLTVNGDFIAYAGTVFGNAPELRIGTFQRSGNNLLLSHAALAGHAYVLQSAPDLNSQWAVVPGTTNLGTGGIVQIVVSNAFSNQRRFYRVQQLQ